MSSVLNAIATLIGEHFVKPFRSGMNDSTYTLVLKILGMDNLVCYNLFRYNLYFVLPVIGISSVSILRVFDNNCFAAPWEP